MLAAASRESLRRASAGAFGCCRCSATINSNRSGPRLSTRRRANFGLPASPLPNFSQQQQQQQRRSFAAGSSSSSYGGDSDSDDEDAPKKKALIVGSSGALGSYVARHFSTQLQMQVLGADVLELPPELTGDVWDGLDAFCQLPRQCSLEELTVQLTESVYDFVHNSDDSDGDSNNRKKNGAGVGLDCLVVAAGGFQADPPAAPLKAPGASLTRDQYLQQARLWAQTSDAVLHQNLHPVLAACSIATQFMNSTAVDTQGAAPPLMVVIGATAALAPGTPGMLGYGASKCAAHHCVQTIGATTGHAEHTGAALRTQSRKLRQHLPSLDHLDVVGILPTTLDTPANRRAMGHVKDKSSWTSIPALTREIAHLLTVPEQRPHSGSLVKIYSDKQQQHDTETGGPTATTGQAVLELVR